MTDKDIIAQINALIKDSPEFEISVIYKKGKEWIVESCMNNTLKKPSKHTSGVKAFNSYRHFHSGIPQFYIVSRKKAKPDEQ